MADVSNQTNVRNEMTKKIPQMRYFDEILSAKNITDEH